MFCPSIRRAAVLGITLFASLRLFASSDPTEVTDPALVVVTATRTAQTADQTLSPITVITRRQIEQSQAGSLEDLLRGQAGVDVANSGGAGKLSSLFLRGASSSQVLVLVDGVKINSPTSGQASLQDIPLELIDHVEIVRGPRSSLYGSEAIGGVIQIFTKKADAQAKPAFMASAGSYGASSRAATLPGVFADKGWYSAGFEDIYTRGFNACKGSSNPMASCGVIEPDADGYHSRTARLSGGWRFDADTQLELDWRQTAGNTQYDGDAFSGNQSIIFQQIASVKFAAHPTSRWQTSLQVGQNQDAADTYYDAMFVSNFSTRRQSASWQNTLDLAAQHQLVAGIDRQQDEVTGSTTYTVSSRDNNGAFAQYLGEFGAQRWEIAARADHNSQFGAKATGSLAWGLTLTDSLRATASWGTAFKAPTFDDLYYPGFANPNLKPEYAHSANLGLVGKFKDGHWSANAYETRLSDLISWNGALPVNIDEARIRGLELESAYQVNQWETSGNVNFLNPVSLAAGSDGNQLPRRAKKSLTLNLDRVAGDWRYGATLRSEGRRFDDLANTPSTAMAGYATVDLRSEYRLDKAWRVQARLENIFNRDYETVYNYNQPRRGVYVTLRYAP